MLQLFAQGLASASRDVELLVNPENALLTVLLMGVLALAGLFCCIWILLQYPRIQNDWASRSKWVRARPWEITSILVLVAIMIFTHAVGAAAAFAAKKFFHVALGENETALFVVQGILFHGVILAGVAGLMIVFKITRQDGFGESTPVMRRIAQGFLFAVGMLPPVWMAAIITQLVMYMLGLDPSLQDVIYYFASDHGWVARMYMLGFGIIVAPIAEELFFRGLLFPALAKAVSVKWGVILSSLIFALIHLHVPAIAPLFVVALACALAYMYTRSLVVPIVMHASFNALNMCMLLLLNG